MSKRAEAREEGLTALHVAAHNGALDCLELLIAKGAAAINHNCAPPARRPAPPSMPVCGGDSGGERSGSSGGGSGGRGGKSGNPERGAGGRERESPRTCVRVRLGYRKQSIRRHVLCDHPGLVIRQTERQSAPSLLLLLRFMPLPLHALPPLPPVPTISSYSQHCAARTLPPSPSFPSFPSWSPHSSTLHRPLAFGDH